MTLSSTANRIKYDGDGSTKDFAFPYYYLATSDLVVVLVDSSGVETVLTETTHYTVTDPDPSGGTVSMVTEPAADEELVIYRDVPMTQGFDPEEGGPLPADEAERAFDKLTMLVQQMSELAGRAIKLNVGSESVDLTLPDPEDGKYLQWKSDLSGLQNITQIDAGTVSISSFAETYLDENNINAFFGVMDRPFWIVDPDLADQSAVGSTGSIAWVLDQLSGSGGFMILPAGGTFDVGDDLTIPATVTVKVMDGAKFSVASTKTLTINGGIEADDHQIFDGSGSVALSSILNKTIFCSWFGTTGALTKTLTALGSTNTRTLSITKTETLSAAVDLSSYDNINLIITKTGKIALGNYNLTVKYLSAGLHEIFDYTGTGVVTLGGEVLRTYPEWFGADYSADAATAFNNAIAAMTAGVLDIKNRDFRIDSTVTLKSNIEIEGEDGSIDFSNATTGDNLFELDGTEDTNRDLASDASQGDLTINVTGASGYFSDDDWVVITNDDDFGGNSGVNEGEWIHITSVAADSFTIGSELIYGYVAASTGKIRPFTFKENVRLRGITAIGSGASGQQRFCDFNMVENIEISKCHISDFEDRSIRLDRVIDFEVSFNKIYRSNRSGFGYGVSVTGGAHGKVNFNYFQECRHAFTSGGTQLPSRFVVIAHNHVTSPTDAALDTHDAAEFFTFDSNMIQGGYAGGTADGIVVQGPGMTIVNNIIIGVDRDGIRIENMVDNDSNPSEYIVKGNRIVRPGEMGIYFYNHSTAVGGELRKLIVNGNQVESPGASGICLHAKNADLSHYTILGNNIRGVAGAGNYCIWIDADTGYTARFGTIIGNTCHRGDDTAENIFLDAADANGITYVSVNGNFIQNGSTGIMGTNTNYIACVGNALTSCTANLSIAGASNEAVHNVG